MKVICHATKAGPRQEVLVLLTKTWRETNTSWMRDRNNNGDSCL